MSIEAEPVMMMDGVASAGPTDAGASSNVPVPEANEGPASETLYIQNLNERIKITSASVISADCKY